ncbi:GATA transcription factor 21-like [Corylus avellana]|uniref:GATA transcription factor 21-like n=1 Tax=Corylus avellana TaxID=13451 RepID=UPI00286C4827|nr:GATA transcription factor 21-like [Corylus avellana]
MTPLYLNPPSPLVDQSQDHHHHHHLKLFLSPHDYQASSSPLCPPNFLDTSQDERGSIFENSLQKPDKPISHGSCHDQQESSVLSSIQSVEEDVNYNPHKFSLCQSADADRSKSSNGSVQWMSSKMRLMQKIMNPNFPATATDDHQPLKIMKKFQNIQQHGENCKINSSPPSNNNSTSTRVCADCNTTTTPLWRSGPRGPKSLCNACGIRQRKARRAMAEAAAAANGVVVAAADISSTKSKALHNKEKKSRTSQVPQHKNKCKLAGTGAGAGAVADSSHNDRKLCFKDLALSLRNNSAFGRVFPQDEAEAAILLMELSCGLVHS